MITNRVILCILDGWGIAPPGPGNAIALANPNNYKNLIEHYPYSQLQAAGIGVGLPDGQDGNTETGHLNIGAGRIVYQDLARINMSIADGSFFQNKTLLSALSHLKKNNSSLHLMGLVTASGVHAYNDHLFALLMFASLNKIENVYLHLFTDGRDSPPKDGLNQIELVQKATKKYGVGRIVSLSGRYYAMDRDQRLDRTQAAFDCLITGVGETGTSPEQVLKNNYNQNVTDEFIKPTLIGNDFKNTRIKKDDAVIFYNFRIDRPRQLTQKIIKAKIENLFFATMTKYHDDFDLPVIFADNPLPNTLGEVIANSHLGQLRASESEKERFVTYYFNGLKEEAFKGEDRLIVPSPKVATYDLRPEMSTGELIEKFSHLWASNGYTLGVINLACPDMVAHTGKVDKTILAIKATDQALKNLVTLANNTSSYLLVTADHGNAEELINKDNREVDTKHSTAPVPLVLYSTTTPSIKLDKGVLGDIAPTILDLLGIDKPPEMTGHSLIIKK